MLTHDIHVRVNQDFRQKLLEAAEDRLGAARSLEDIVAIVRSTARSVCSADGVAFVLRDNGKCHYIEEDAIGPLWKGQKFPMEACISGWCMLNRTTAAIEDIFVDDRIPHDVYRKTFVKSLVMVPVGGASPVAAMGAYWRDKRAFNEEDVKVVEALGNAVSGAMQRLAA
ncbi:MAG: GAF domain-containing protein [Proteobacteria bacterium]|nr:GAF domain-containing protein [Pseudomonadota bacterium]